MEFSDFLAHSSDAERPKGTIIDGAFVCQTCNEQCGEAEYFMIEKILKWTCSEGHVSYIKDFL
jgi:hypothetical protein